MERATQEVGRPAGDGCGKLGSDQGHGQGMNEGVRHGRGGSWKSWSLVLPIGWERWELEVVGPRLTDRL